MFLNFCWQWDKTEAGSQKQKVNEVTFLTQEDFKRLIESKQLLPGMHFTQNKFQ